MLKVKVYIIFLIVIIFTGILNAQSFSNGNFNSGGTGWGASTETHPENVYGGNSNTNNVAEVDYQVRLAQTVTGFQVGKSYTLSFNASRRTKSGASSPNPSTINISITSSTSTLLSTSLTKTNTIFSLDYVSYDFTATASTLTFSLTPGTDIGTSTKGVIVDNLLISQTVVLSAELISFEAEKNYEGVKLKWTTASEVKNDYFAVEKSRNGKQWQEVSKVNGAGFSIKMTDYHVQDNKPFEGLSYYRLKQVDFDGEETYSDIISVEFDYADVFNIYPNPAHNYQELFLESTLLIKDIHVKIVDHKGLEVHSAMPIFGSISLKNIPSGSYLLNVFSGNEQLSSSKLIVY